ncbi:hypothetical protein ABVT39_022316 [Epinephelus coioides]|uniref:cyclic AMP-dependent transcription factor ATF-1 isoform X1 n=2 Tax=Epinephelus moara TaxID=300413 RepID=UPI00214F4E23|nr:cyclic AMP-dependent transcription factor ATF-1 isoform X1 [Epinephelus moara]XP_049893846.1 cyclic AMP-dependent transcription factor ATF-1 isoform X1 [Epinephelus moara]WES10360.1 activating transcription factor 1 [Epinephelus coioides]
MEEVQQGSNGTELQTATIPTTITSSQFSQIAQQMSLGGGSVAVVQLPGGQFQVQGVIQSAQSVIQSPPVHTAQALDSDSDDSQDSSDSGAAAQKTREILARRPSYKKILNDLSAEEVTHIEGKANSPATTGVTAAAPQIYQTSTGQYITIAANGTIQLATPGSEGIQGLQAVAMANSGGAQPSTTILQYAQTPDGQQILVPSNQVVVQGAGGEMQTYQIRTAPTSSSLPQTVVMTSPVGLPQGKSDDPTMKREIRLAKNREAARECRRKKKEYVKCLENRVAVLENQNKTLIEELKTLKDLYCVKTG